MSGLLLKDFYLTIKYCKSYLIYMVIFSLIALIPNSGMIIIFYPCIVTAMLPTTLYAYDEREKWCAYSRTLPVSAAQYVSAKYLLGLATAAIVLCQVTVVLAFTETPIWSMLCLLIAVILLGQAAVLPFIFKFGTEKGRIICYCVMAALFVLAFIMQSNALIIQPKAPTLLIGAVILYILSWLLSVFFYKKREI